MIRKQQKRAARGKHHTAFRVGGQKVDSKRIARFINRYSASWNELDNSDDQEPSESYYVEKTWEQELTVQQKPLPI